MGGRSGSTHAHSTGSEEVDSARSSRSGLRFGKDRPGESVGRAGGNEERGRRKGPAVGGIFGWASRLMDDGRWDGLGEKTSQRAEEGGAIDEGTL